MRSLLLAAFAITIPAAAHALTGSDVLDKMNNDERNGFLEGVLEMRAYDATVAGKPQLAECIYGWNRNGGPTEEIQALDHFRDRDAVAVVYLLIKRRCGE